MHWKKISLPGYEIIFPAAIAADAQSIARLLSESEAMVEWSLDLKPAPISLILNNQTTVSNGFVTLAPRRAEWFSTPSQSAFSGPLPWYRLLAVHEGRHVVQFDKANQGFIRLAGSLFGEMGRSAATFLTFPNWLFEGDAVAAETGLTFAGRGRQPSFVMKARAQILAGRRFSYAKAYLGSYTDEYLDSYSLGYLMVAYGRKLHGSDLWSRVFRSAAINSGSFIFGFNRALAEETGYKTAAFYREMIDFLELRWKKEERNAILTPFRVVKGNTRRVWTSYSGPQYDETGALLAVKHGLGDYPAIVRLHADGREEKIRSIATLDLDALRVSQANGRIVFSESIPHIRWGKKTGSALVFLDLRKGSLRRLHKSSRLHSPAISPDGESVAAIEYSDRSACRLVILSASDGMEKTRFDNPDNDFLFTPAWSEDGRRLTFVRQGISGATIAMLDIATRQQRDLMPLFPAGASHPVFFDRYILFSSPINGIDNIQAVEIETGRRFRVTAVSHGAFSPAIDPSGKKMAFSHYTAKGWEVAEIPLVPSAWIPIEETTTETFRLYEPLARQEKHIQPRDWPFPENRTFPQSDYSPGRHLLRVHSWGIGPNERGYGLRIISNDLLNLASLQAGLEYDISEKVMRLAIDGSWRRWFPVVDVGLSFGGRRVEGQFFNEMSGTLGLRLPLDFSRGMYRAGVDIGAFVMPTYVMGQSSAGSATQNRWQLPVGLQMQAYRYRRGCSRDILPRAGQELSLVWRDASAKTGPASNQFIVRAGVYFPGLADQHVLRIRYAAQWQKTGDYPFASLLPLPRGCRDPLPQKGGVWLVDYTFPLAYPDASIGSALYLKRVRGSLFFDRLVYWDNGSRKPFTSAGIEMLGEVHLFSIMMPIEIGARLTYCFRESRFRFEPLVLTLAF